MIKKILLINLLIINLLSVTTKEQNNFQEQDKTIEIINTPTKKIKIEDSTQYINSISKIYQNKKQSEVIKNITIDINKKESKLDDINKSSNIKYKILEINCIFNKEISIIDIVEIQLFCKEDKTQLPLKALIRLVPAIEKYKVIGSVVYIRTLDNDIIRPSKDRLNQIFLNQQNNIANEINKKDINSLLTNFLSTTTANLTTASKAYLQAKIASNASEQIAVGTDNSREIIVKEVKTPNIADYVINSSITTLSDITKAIFNKNKENKIQIEYLFKVYENSKINIIMEIKE